MSPSVVSDPRRLRRLFEALAGLDRDERAARVARLDRNDPDVALLLHLLDAHDHAEARLDMFEFLRPRHVAGPAHSGFDAAAAFAPAYVIEGELDGGGMSLVFHGHDAKLGRRIVAKVLPPASRVEVDLGRFQQEIRLAAQLRHPHIVPLLESGEVAGCLYYTMPFIEGESLRDRLRRDGSLPVSVALHIAAEIADALAYAHARGVIHRDIKPGNVLIDSGHAVVADFGIARALHDAVAATVTRSGAVIGTPAYMSPEQASGKGVVDARTDVYSLGCVLYEMLYGAPPSAGVVAFAPDDRASSVRVPARVRAIVLRAMAARPADRFQSAQEMRAALLAVAAPRIAAHTVWTAAAASVVLGVGAWAALRPSTDRSFASPQAVVRRVTSRGDVTLAAITPGGRYFAFVTSDTNILRIGEIDAGTQRIVETGDRALPTHPRSIRQVSWSRDGTILYFLPEPFRMVEAVEKLGPWRMVIANPLLAGPSRAIGSESTRPASGFAISPRDSSLAVWRAPVTPDDRGPARIVHERIGYGYHVDTIDVRVDMRWATLGFSPDGRWLAACGGSRDHDAAWRLALIATNGTTQRLLDSANVSREACGVIWSARGDSLYVWPTPTHSGLASYAIDEASGMAKGPPVPFRLRQPAAGERTSFSLSADGKRVAYVEHTLRRSVAVAELGAGIEVPSRDAELGAQDPRWPAISPVGDRFAYIVAGDSGSAIYTRELRGGEPQPLSREYREGISGVRWSDDALRIATLTRRDSQTVILILDATGVELMTVRPRHAVSDTSLLRPSFDWAARGTGIMYTTVNRAKGRPEVWLIDLASGRERLLLAAEEGTSARRPSLPVWSPDGKSILYDSLGILSIKDAATGAGRAAPSAGGTGPCQPAQAATCESGALVPLRWRADGVLFSERLDGDGATTIWRSTVSEAPRLFARFGKECKQVSMDRQARGAVCQVTRDESDVFLVTRP